MLEAHLEFNGCEVILPAHTPYDRQQLVEYVCAVSRGTPRLRVHVDHLEWSIHRPDAPPALVCSSCTQRVTRVVCCRSKLAAPLCATCALARPHLTIGFLERLPLGTVLHDVQAQSVSGAGRMAWTRWPQATPTEIVDDILLQRRFAPVLTWRCAEIRLPPLPAAGGAPGTRSASYRTERRQPERHRAQLIGLKRKAG